MIKSSNETHSQESIVVPLLFGGWQGSLLKSISLLTPHSNVTLKKWRIRCCCPNNAFQLPEKKMHPPPRVGRFTLFVSQRCAEEGHGNIHFKSGPEKTCEKCASLNRAIINFSLAPHCCHTVCPFSGHHRAYGHMK